MPRLDGWGFLTALQGDAPDPRPSVLVWSVASEDELERARLLGAVECLARSKTAANAATRGRRTTCRGACGDSADAQEQWPALADDRTSHVEKLHLQLPVAVEAAALQMECRVKRLADLELGGQLPVVEENGFDRHAAECLEAGLPVLALHAKLTTLGDA